MLFLLLLRLLDDSLLLFQEGCRTGAINGTMVERVRQYAHRAYCNRITVFRLDHDRPFGDRIYRQDRDLGLVDNRRGKQRAEQRPWVGQRLGTTLQLIGCLDGFRHHRCQRRARDIIASPKHACFAEHRRANGKEHAQTGHMVYTLDYTETGKCPAFRNSSAPSSRVKARWLLWSGFRSQVPAG